jgi:hypothetical protein
MSYEEIHKILAKHQLVWSVNTLQLKVGNGLMIRKSGDYVMVLDGASGHAALRHQGEELAARQVKLRPGCGQLGGAA